MLADLFARPTVIPLMMRGSEQGVRVADSMGAGLVWINIVPGDAAELPFGGVKRSGSGREMRRYAMEKFVNEKLIRIV